MDSRDDAIVQLARLGLKGDAASVGRFAKKLLRTAAGNGITDKTRAVLAELVTSHAADSLRFVPARYVSEATPGSDFVMPNHVEEPVLADAVHDEIQTVLAEHARSDVLERVGLTPTRSLILTGPPGVGKTITALFMAHQLGLPLVRLDLSTLMSSYLGRTGKNLRDVLATAKDTPSVLLLDEFDAIAKRRDDPADVGELKRIVNVLLLELESWPASSLLVAATNHPELLDRAIWRRFEKVVKFELPSEGARRQLFCNEMARLGQSLSEQAVATVVAATVGASCSDVVEFTRRCVKRGLLSDRPVEEVVLDEALRRVHGVANADAKFRANYCRVAKDAGLSQREIASHLGISHVMVGKLLRVEQSVAQGTKRRANGKR